MLAPATTAAISLTQDGREKMKRAFRPVRKEFEFSLEKLLASANFSGSFTYVVADTTTGGSHHKGLRLAMPIEAQHAVELRFQWRSNNERFRLLLRLPHHLKMDVFEFHTRMDLAMKEEGCTAEDQKQGPPRKSATMSVTPQPLDDAERIEKLMAALQPSATGIVSRQIVAETWTQIVGNAGGSNLDSLVVLGHFQPIEGSQEFLRVGKEWLPQQNTKSIQSAQQVVAVEPKSNEDADQDDDDPNWRQNTESYLNDIAVVVNIVQAVYNDARWNIYDPPKLYRGYAINAISILVEEKLTPRNIGRIIEVLKRRGYLSETEEGDKRVLLKTPPGLALLTAAKAHTTKPRPQPIQLVSPEKGAEKAVSAPKTLAAPKLLDHPAGLIDQVEHLKQQVDSAKKYRDGIKALEKREADLKEELASVLSSKAELEQKLEQVNDAAGMLAALRTALFNEE